MTPRRALGLLSFAFLFAASGCKTTPPTETPAPAPPVTVEPAVSSRPQDTVIVPTKNGDVGQPAQVGGKLYWKLQNGDTTGYEVRFPKDSKRWPAACKSTDPIRITPQNPEASCDFAGTADSTNHKFFYKIVQLPPTRVITPPPPSPPGPGNIIVDSVIPCRGCE